MDHTSRMTALLGAFRRERNGAVADAMRFYGSPCGLNYGVSLPTLRTLARAEGCDHAFARYLYLQQVRELRLAAFHIADPAQVTADEFPFWAGGLLNSEMAEEGAFALFGRMEHLPALFAAWTSPASAPLTTYAALMAAARSAEPSDAWAATAVARRIRMMNRFMRSVFCACEGCHPFADRMRDFVAPACDVCQSSISGTLTSTHSSTSGEKVILSRPMISVKI